MRIMLFLLFNYQTTHELCGMRYMGSVAKNKMEWEKGNVAVGKWKSEMKDSSPFLFE